MKRKTLDLSQWPRIAESVCHHTRQVVPAFNGYVGIAHIQRIHEPLVVDTNGHTYCVAGDDFTWTQWMPRDTDWVLTTALDKENGIVQWYFDVTGGKGMLEGEPYFDDLYLDVVTDPTGAIELLDEDELLAALNEGDIDQSAYDHAYRIAGEIMTGPALDIPMLTRQAQDIIAFFADE